MAQDAVARGLPAPDVMRFYINKIEELGHTFPCKYEISG
jgi:hypothetical protein